MGQDSDERKEGLEVILEAVYLYFKGNRGDVETWLSSPNAQLGGETPLNLIRSNRFDVLADHVRTMINEMD